MKNHENHGREYIGEITQELAKMARTQGLDILARLLDMAVLEAGVDAKGNKGPSVERHHA